MIFNISTMLSVIFLSHSNRETLLNNKISAKTLFYLLFTSVSINIVFRDFNYADTISYANAFSEMRYLGFLESLQYFRDEKLFNIIIWTVAQLTDNSRIFFLVIWFVFAIPFVKALFKLFAPWQAAILFFTYLNFPFFHLYTQNTIRQGVTISLIFFAMALWFKGEKGKMFYFALVIAPLFHWTGLPFSLILFFASKINISLNKLIGIWVLLAVALVTNMNTLIMSPFQKFIPNIDKFTGTTAILGYGGKINRIDFLAFSAVFLVIGILLYLFIYKEDSYKNLIKIYILFNSLFLILGFVAYSDRIAIYSWFLIPVLVWYPILKSGKFPVPLTYLIIVISFAVGYFTGSFDNYNPFNLFSQ